MTDAPSDPRLAQWAEHIERLQWSAMILDADWHLRWVSSELKGFIGTQDESELGYGLHIAEMFLSEAWMRTVHRDSQIELFLDIAPYLIADFRSQGRDLAEVLPEPFLSLLDQIEPAETPPVWSMSFLYVDPHGGGDLPDYRVDALTIRMQDHTENMIGWMTLFYMGVRPSLITLLARGDEHMYERMARLVEPGPRQAAILFCDLHQSTALARQLSTPAYFKLVRRLWMGIDAVVAQEKGIVGKHAGDGASAFFLVSDLGSASAAAAGAARAARRIHEISEEVFSDTIDDACQMKVGLHWGASLYMGQLVPGGRLDVTALGDEVNEAARIQECAEPHQTLASKQMLEQLSSNDAAALGLDLEKLRYRTLADITSASDKAIKDAGGVSITPL